MPKGYSNNKMKKSLKMPLRGVAKKSIKIDHIDKIYLICYLTTQIPLKDPCQFCLAKYIIYLTWIYKRFQAHYQFTQSISL